MRYYLKKLIPEFILNYRRKILKSRAEAKRELLKKQGEVVHENDIINALKSAGIQEGDDVMIHSSLSSLGYVEGGALCVIKAFKKIVGNKGNILMPSFPATGYNFDYMSDSPIFNVRETPSQMGVITETFRNMKGVMRSLHPMDPVCVFGPLANWYTSEHFGQLVPHNEKSPFKKLVSRKGKIVLLGVKLESVTNFHTIEDEIENFAFPVYHDKIFTGVLIDENGKKQSMQTKVHNPEMSKKRQCNAFESDFLEHGVMRKFNLSDAYCAVIDAEAMHNRLLELYAKGITIYNPSGLN